MGYLYILLTVVLTVYGQMIIKWRVTRYGELPSGFYDTCVYLINVLLDPFVLSGFFAALLASLTWIAAMTKFDISYAYPFMSSAFILVFLLSVVFFQEPVTWQKIAGLLLIVSGIVITSRSM